MNTKQLHRYPVHQHSADQHSADQHSADQGRIVALRGQILSAAHRPDGVHSNNIYKVLEGEVLIVRNGRTVDLVEAGEWLDAQIWTDATAVAWTDCILENATPRQSPRNCLAPTRVNQEGSADFYAAPEMAMGILERSVVHDRSVQN